MEHIMIYLWQKYYYESLNFLKSEKRKLNESKITIVATVTLRVSLILWKYLIVGLLIGPNCIRQFIYYIALNLNSTIAFYLRTILPELRIKER